MHSDERVAYHSLKQLVDFGGRLLTVVVHLSDTAAAVDEHDDSF